MGGLVLLAFVALSMAAVVWSDSSTAALGFLTLPAFGWLIVLATFAALLFLSGRREPSPPAADQP